MMVFFQPSQQWFAVKVKLVLLEIVFPFRFETNDIMFWFYCHDVILFYNYFGILNILFQRIPPFSLSMESQTSMGLPTIWFSGTKPQKRESAELWRLSPIIQ